MAEYTIRYWFGGEPEDAATAYVSEGIQADDVDEATRRVKERMSQPLFAIDSDGYGRVVINSTRIRFCSILPAASAEESAARSQASVSAQVQDNFAARAAAAVDREVRRF